MTIFTVLLYAHIAFGSISLLVGLYVLLAKKGDKTHKQIGNIFYFAMLLSSLISLQMAILHPNYFLFAVGIFTLYLLLSGKRYLKIKTLTDVKIIDRILSILMLLFSIAFIILGANNIYHNNLFGIVFLVFGGLGLLNVYQDLTYFKGQAKTKNFGLVTHLQRMIGSYIATTTAFLVVNNHILPDILAWLLPTICFVPLQIIWTQKYRVAK